MTLSQLAQFALALALPLQAWLLMHRAVPRVIDTRGHWQGHCHMLLAIVLILGFQPWLERALHGAPFNPWAAGRDGLLLAYAWCRYRWALRMAEASWTSRA